MSEAYERRADEDLQVHDSGDLPESLGDLESHSTHPLDEIAALPEEVRDQLWQLADPAMTFDQAFALIGELNEQHGLQGPPQGIYNVLHVDVPPTADGISFDVRVKVFADMGNALSFGISRES